MESGEPFQSGRTGLRNRWSWTVGWLLKKVSQQVRTVPIHLVIHLAGCIPTVTVQLTRCTV
jgi:hypothetical protein